MKSLFNNIFLVACLVGMAGAGCKKQFDINIDPNVPEVSNGTPSVVFPSGVFGTTAAVGGEYAILGAIWGEYVTQSAVSNQYKTIDAYQLSNTDLNRPYRFLYANGLKNYQFVIDKSKETQNWNFYIMGAVMKAYSAQVLVDLYDQIPYFEALQGTVNLTPKFDDGYTIYVDLLKLLDTALSKPLNGAILTASEKSADLIFGGNMDKWVRFANSLELKMYLRMVNKKPAEAQAGIQKLYAKNAKFLDVDAGVTGFTNVAGKDNPMYEYNIRSLNTPDNIRASKTFTSFLVSNGDPRVVSFFGTASPIPVNQGDYAGTDPTYKNATILKQAATDPVVFISLPESYFMQAEALERYFGGAGAKAMYDAGVQASFTQTGAGSAAAFLAAGGKYEYPAAGTLDQKIEAISVQKWISCAYGVHYLEGFFEKNRTGYPRTSAVYSTSTSYVPGQFVISKNSVLGAGLLPRRLVFPQSESQANPNTPAIVPITTPVWWAK